MPERIHQSGPVSGDGYRRLVLDKRSGLRQHFPVMRHHNQSTISSAMTDCSGQHHNSSHTDQDGFVLHPGPSISGCQICSLWQPATILCPDKIGQLLPEQGTPVFLARSRIGPIRTRRSGLPELPPDQTILLGKFQNRFSAHGSQGFASGKD